MKSKNLIDISQNHPVLLYDGVCALCNASIKWVIKRDRNDHFRFLPLQELADDFLPQNMKGLQSVVLIYQGEFFAKSDAALKTAVIVGRGWQLLNIFSIIPKLIRNGVYEFIAGQRYKWFGQYEACPIPEPGIRHKFLHMVPATS